MSRGERVAIFALPALLCAAWTVFAGKDVNWDLLNYHYYLPYEWLHDRVLQDYFAASGQGYLNPVGFVPFYLLAASCHSVIASMALAAMHSVNLALLYLIAWRLFAHRDPGERRLLSLLAATVGGASAIFWATVGSSFLEPLLTVPMLAGVLLLIEPGRAHPLAAGLLFGVAGALKYSNAIFALAALPLALVASPRRGRAGLAYVAGGVAAVALLAGPWLVLMGREFDNPVFPLFNAWFKSPHAPQANMFAGRFAIADIGAALAFPFELVAPGPLLYAEITAPDLRFAALVVAAAAAFIVTPLGLRRPAGALTGADWRLLGFFALAFALWLATSVNGRYGLIVLLLAGVCLVRITERLLPISARAGSSPTAGPRAGFPSTPMNGHGASPRSISPSRRCRWQRWCRLHIRSPRSSTFAGSTASRRARQPWNRSSSATAFTYARSAGFCNCAMTAGRGPRSSRPMTAR